ncbi:MAG TPA: hypothetical protein VFJ85_01200 [Acidimicrobiales bacterium]|nr:hypothetical protein [Acidimicrobiales bacterium]
MVETTRPPPGGASLQLPTGPLARLLAGLCRQGEPPTATSEADGWATYRWRGLDGGEGRLELRTAEHPDHCDDDERAARALERAAREPVSAAELAAVLTRLVELDGADGQWCWARVTELLRGRRAKTDRHNGPIQGWLALLERARWHLAPPRTAGADRQAKPGPAVVAGQPLVTIERHTRCSATAHLHTAGGRQLRAECRSVPASTLDLAAPAPNPEGNHPSRAVRARARLAAIFATAAGAGDVAVDDLMAGYGGVDLGPVTRRRHTAGWTDHVLEEVVSGLRAVGHHLAELPHRARRALATVVRLARPAPATEASARHTAPSGVARSGPAARPGTPGATPPQRAP